MSIKGVDAQMMIARTAELSKESTAQLKRGELMQDYLAVQTRAAEVKNTQTVAKTLKAQEALIHPDREGSGTGYEGNPGGGTQPREQTAEPEEPMSSDGKTHIIDIKV